MMNWTLATVGQGRDENWLGMHPKLADTYMMELAEEMARERGFHPTTDETMDHVAVSGVT